LLENGGEEVFALPWVLAHDHLVANEPQAVYVAAPVHLMPVDLLRGHIGRGPQGGSRDGEARILIPWAGDPEVGQACSSDFFVDVDVFGLDVAMNDPTAVGVGQSRGDILENGKDLGDRQRSFLGQNLLQVPPGNMFHQEGEAPIRETMRTVQPDDVRMLELSDQVCLTVQAPHGLLV
jgi:hypothetical protein